MKNYFDFVLPAKKLLPWWLMFYVFFITPYALFVKFLITAEHMHVFDSLTSGTPDIAGLLSLLGIGVAFFVMFVFMIIFGFYWSKISIQGVKYKDEHVNFTGVFSKYLGTLVLGYFLSYITLGIYSPWFIRKIIQFMVDHTSLDETHFEFKGTGGKLFLIYLLTLFVPMILFVVVSIVFTDSLNNEYSFLALYDMILFICMIPFLYCYYKWLFNIQYKEYHIKWNTTFGASIGTILLHVFLTIITLGIYMPLACLKLYEYFIGKTVAESENEILYFGYELDPLHDFGFIWGQTLLTIITLGVYYPWAYIKIRQRVLSKTYLSSNNADEELV